MDIKSINLFGKSIIKWVTIEQPLRLNTPMPENEACFVHVLKGGCINFTEQDALKLLSKDSVLSKCGNSTFKTISIDGKEEYSAISIHFHKEILEKIYEKSVLPFFKNQQKKLTVNSVHLGPTELIKQYIQNLKHYINHPQLATEELIILKLKEIILLLLQTENAPEVLGIMTNLFEKKTFEFKEIIKAHIYSSIRIEELAQLTNLSLSAFKKEFKRIYNDTPNNYLIEQRIIKVAELLPVSNDSISTIAYICEFKTLAHMSRVFKTKYGISPTEYKRNFSDKH